MIRTQYFLLAALASAAFLAPTHAADQKATARDRYYEAAADDGGGEPAWRGVRTSVLLRRDRKGKEPAIRLVGENYRFLSGDSFRLRVESNFDAYLYLFLRDSSGEVKLLFPYEGAKAKSNLLTAFDAKSVPGRQQSWFRFDAEPGEEQVFLFLSAKPIAELEQLQKGNRTSLLRQLERLIAKNGPPTFLRSEEDDLEDGGDQGATYYVEKRTPRRQFLVRRLDLMHDTE